MVSEHAQNLWRQFKAERRRDAADAQFAAADRRIQTYLDSIETTVEPPFIPPERPREAEQQIRIETLRSLPEARINWKRISALERCSSAWAIFDTDRGLKLHAIRCRQRLCPICEDRRAAQVYATTHSIMKLMSSPKHITLTLRSTDQPLRDQLDFLTKCFRRLRQRDLWRRRSPWGYQIVEVTRNPVTVMYHPHLHIMVNMPFLPWVALQQAWTEITYGSSDVYIEAVEGDRAAFLARYVGKAMSIYNSDLNPFEAAANLRGKRLLQPFGKFPILPPRKLPRCIRLCSVRHAILKAAGGDPYYQYLVNWIKDTAPAALLLELPPTPRPEQSP